MKLTKQIVRNLIDAESTIDSLVEETIMHDISPKAYQMFRDALAQFEDDCELQGIVGKWDEERMIDIENWTERDI